MAGSIPSKFHILNINPSLLCCAVLCCAVLYGTRPIPSLVCFVVLVLACVEGVCISEAPLTFTVSLARASCLVLRSLLSQSVNE
jgi:hypothetical protein